MKHTLTSEERSRGGKNGFRAAIFKVQCEYGLEFNDAVCWLKRKIGWQKGVKNEVPTTIQPSGRANQGV